MGKRKLSDTHPIFLAGVYRSGTTLLRLMLNAHSRIAIPVESHFLSELIYDYPTNRQLSAAESQCIGDFIASHERFEHWETSPTQLKNAIGTSDGMTIAGLIDLLYRLEVGNSTPRWGDKTPGYERHFDRLADVFPNARFIHIYRDGRDVSNSMCERSWHGITEFQRARYWKRSMEQAFRSAAKLGSQRCLNVQYESLVKQPEAILKQICTFLDEDYESEMLQFIGDAKENVVDQKIHSKLTRLPDPRTDLQRWKQESSATRVLIFEALAGHSLKRGGYDLSCSSTSRQLTRIAYWLPGFTLASAHETYLKTPASWRSGLRQSGLIRKLRDRIYRRRRPTKEAKSA